MELMGEHVVLTPVVEGDLDFIGKMQSDRELWRYEEAVPEDREAIRRKFRERMESGLDFDFVIRSLEDGGELPVGTAHVWSYNLLRQGWEVGYAILPAHQRRGYGAESVSLLLKFAFEELFAHKVVGLCNRHNRASAAVMEQAGMTREAVFREELFWRERWTDQWIYSMLDREYFRGNRGR